jgi:hypothetical protein
MNDKKRFNYSKFAKERFLGFSCRKGLIRLEEYSKSVFSLLQEKRNQFLDFLILGKRILRQIRNFIPSVRKIS